VLQDPPEGWRENELGKPSIFYDGSAYKNILYTVIKPTKVEKLVRTMVEKIAQRLANR
jgi:hypothetical protein